MTYNLNKRGMVTFNKKGNMLTWGTLSIVYQDFPTPTSASLYRSQASCNLRSELGQWEEKMGKQLVSHLGCILPGIRSWVGNITYLYYRTEQLSLTAAPGQSQVRVYFQQLATRWGGGAIVSAGGDICWLAFRQQESVRFDSICATLVSFIGKHENKQRMKILCLYLQWLS